MPGIYNKRDTLSSSAKPETQTKLWEPTDSPDMTEPKPNKTPPNVPISISYINNSHTNKPNSSFSGQNVHFLNTPDPEIPDAVTLREQWKFAIRQYSRWYSPAWGSTILAGVSFFALGWFIKGGNPFLYPLPAATTTILLFLLPTNPMKLNAHEPHFSTSSW